MSDEEAKFRLVVDADGADADGLATSLQALQETINADKAALAGMTGALRAMKAGGLEGSAAFGELRAQIDAQRSAIAGATESYVELGGTFTKVGSDAEALAAPFGSIEAAAQQAQGAVDGLGQSTDKAQSPLDQLGIGAEAAGGKLGQLKQQLTKIAQLPGPVAAIAAVVLLTAALVAGVVALAEYALGVANAARDQGLMVAALEKTSPSLAGVGEAIRSVHAATGVTTDKLKGLAKELSAAKVSAKDMPAALKAMAQAEAALGEGGAADFMQQLKDGKKTVGELSKEIDSKFGSIVKARMLGLDQQFAAAKENVAAIFSGVKIDGFLGGLKNVLSMLDANTASGKALRHMATTMLQPIIDGATAALPIAKGLFQGLVVGALIVAIGLVKLRNAFRDAFGGDVGSNIDWVKTAMYAAAYVVLNLAGALAVVAAVVAIAAAPFIYFGEQVWDTIETVGAAIDGLSDIFSGGAGDAVSSLIDGLVDGIAAGVGAVGSAMMELASSAVSALMSGLDAHSPSRKTKKVGGFAPAGVVEGVEEGKGDVQEAMRTIVEIPSDVDPQAQGAKAGKGVAGAAAKAVASEGAGGASKSSGGGERKLEVHFHGVPGAKEMATDSWLAKAADALEAAAARAGIALEPEGATA